MHVSLREAIAGIYLLISFKCFCNLLLLQSNLEIVNSRDYLKETISRSSIITVLPALKLLSACFIERSDCRDLFANFFQVFCNFLLPQSNLEIVNSRDYLKEAIAGFPSNLIFLQIFYFPYILEMKFDTYNPHGNNSPKFSY